MSGIIRKVEMDLAKYLAPKLKQNTDVGSVVEVILSHEDLAIVDREVELPRFKVSNRNRDELKIGWYIQRAMRKDGWVKEVK